MKQVISYILITSLLILTACEKWLDVNKNPNYPEEVNIEFVLPAGISSAGYVFGGWYQIVGSLWAQHWAQSPGASQYQNFDSYDIRRDDLDQRQFGELFYGALKDLQYVKENAHEQENWRYYLMASTMQVYIYQYMVDLYDSIPYTDALKGDQGNIMPKYNSGPEVYDALIAQLDTALSKDVYAETAKDPGSYDLVFEGNINAWKQLANTLKLKLYLRQCYARPAIAEAGISDLLTSNTEFLAIDASMVQFVDEPSKRNPFVETEYVEFGRSNIVLSHTLASYLQEEIGGLRIDGLFAKPLSQGSEHRAVIQGNYNDLSYSSSNYFSQPKLTAESPVYFMCKAESYFLQAEAHLRYGDPAEATRLYRLGMESSFVSLGYPATSANQLFEDYFIVFTGDPAYFERDLEMIIVQKWIALANKQGLEAWIEHNRTGYPQISDVTADNDNYEAGQFTVSISSVLAPGAMPKRLPYPDSEYTGNPNIPQYVPITTGVWWDTDRTTYTKELDN